MKYVILLRGVNVGGARKVPKVEFKQVLESIGFSNVVTYVNSGNAVGEATSPIPSRKVEAALESHFGFAVPTLVLPARQVRAIAEAIPEDWTNDAPKPDESGQKSDVLYLFESANTSAILERLGFNPAVESMIYVDGAVLANITRMNQSKGSLQRIVGTPLYKEVTVRNITTAKMLAKLSEEA